MKLQKNNNNVLILQSVNHELSTFGFQITKKEFNALIRVKNKTCDSLGFIDIGTQNIEHIISVFKYSPYIKIENFINTLKEIIILFYSFKSHQVKTSLYDSELIERFYQIYLKQHGCLDKSIVISLIHEVSKDE